VPLEAGLNHHDGALTVQGKPGEIRNIPVSKPKEDEIAVKITHVSLVCTA
jgi:Zn-dependent alcohol dehydrogenase